MKTNKFQISISKGLTIVSMRGLSFSLADFKALTESTLYLTDHAISISKNQFSAIETLLENRGYSELPPTQPYRIDTGRDETRG